MWWNLYALGANMALGAVAFGALAAALGVGADFIDGGEFHPRSSFETWGAGGAGVGALWGVARVGKSYYS